MMNPTTHSIRSTHQVLLGAIAFATMATVAATAQDASESAKTGTPTHVLRQQEPTGTYTSTGRILGAKIKLSPDAEAKAAAARKGEKAEPPTATATEWLIDVHDGTLQYAVVSIGGFLGMGDKTMLVPAGDLQWNQATEQFQLDWTPQQLEARTPFDLSKASETGLDGAAKAAISASKGGEPATKDGVGTADASTKTSTIVGTQFLTVTNRLCKASDLSALPVRSSNEEFGKVADLIIDRGQRRVVLAVVNHGTTLGMGGTSYLVPFAKLTPCAKSGEAVGNPTLLLAATTTTDQLSKSVVYEQPKNGVVDPAAAKQALSKTTARD